MQILYMHGSQPTCDNFMHKQKLLSIRMFHLKMGMLLLLVSDVVMAIDQHSLFSIQYFLFVIFIQKIFNIYLRKCLAYLFALSIVFCESFFLYFRHENNTLRC